MAREVLPLENQNDGEVVTHRTLTRHREDELFVPVIVKRTDETRRHVDDVLQSAIEAGCEQFRRSWLSLGLSAVLAGLMLGLSVMAVAIATVATMDSGSPLLSRFLPALVYPLGFVVCIMSGTELFTEHTATAVYPVLDRRSSFAALLRLWSVVLAGNLVGALTSAALAHRGRTGDRCRAGYIAIGHHLVEFDAFPLLASAVLAGWLMALGGWLVFATPPTISQIVSIYIVTLLIGLGRLHHCIAGAAEMFAALFASDAVQRLAGDPLHCDRGNRQSDRRIVLRGDSQLRTHPQEPGNRR